MADRKSWYEMVTKDLDEKQSEIGTFGFVIT